MVWKSTKTLLKFALWMNFMGLKIKLLPSLFDIVSELLKFNVLKVDANCTIFEEFVGVSENA